MLITNSWITGFVDGDGCFNIQKKVTKNNKIVTRYRFIVSQDKRSVDVLYALKKKFKCGSVHKAGNNMMEFAVTDRKSILNIIIPFFIKYPLQTEKRKNFYKLVESLNKNLNNPAYEDFYFNEMKKFKIFLNDEWVAGFIDAEGCFSVSIVKNYPRPQLVIGVPEKEKFLINSLQNYLQCGSITIRKHTFVIFQIASCKDFKLKIFPKLFTKTNKNLLKTIKRISFQKFRKIVLLISEKKHLSSVGMEKIHKLKLLINNYLQK